MRVVAVSFAALALIVTARDAIADGAERVWARGVSERDQSRATALFDEGNGLLDEGLYARALEIYQRALEHWSHPSIHYNSAIALINLDRPVDAYEQLELALRFGEEALDKEVYQQANVFRRLLDGQLGGVTIECDQPGVRASLDGKEVLECPGTKSVLVRSGEHQVVAERAEHLTLHKRFVVVGGERRSLRVHLIPIDKTTVTRRRWAAWKPWAVVGAGVAMELLGAGLEAKARATFESYDDAVAVLCQGKPCATLPEVVDDAYDRGRLQDRVAVGLFAAGGLTIAAGITLVILNRPIEERIGYGDVELVPVVNADGGGVAGRVRF